MPHDASAEELKALRKLVRPSWIHVVDHNTDRQSENKTACCNKLPRISELRDYSISLHSPNAWFQHGDTKLENPRYFYIERDLQGLDDEAWAFLKGEALPRLIAKDPSQSRGWQQLFDTLNEAKGYNHLVQIGCAYVKFIPRSTTNKIRTPDLRGLLSSMMVLCEVKTINVSKIEADRINEGGVGTTQAYLDEGFFNKLLSDLQTASSQMLAFSTEVATRRIAYIVVNFDDRLHECADEYEDQIVAYLTGVSMPAVEVVLDIKPTFSVM